MVQKLSDFVSQAAGIIQYGSGIWTPTLVGVSYVPNATGGWYRIGGTVHVYGQMSWSSLDNTDISDFSISSLPFNASPLATNSVGYGVINRIQGLDFGGVSGASPTQLSLRPRTAPTYLILYANFSLGSATSPGESNPVSYQQCATSGLIQFGATYHTLDSFP